MKTLLIKIIVCCGVLSPFTQVQAKTYGDFAPGKTFYLKLKTKISKSGFSNAPIPAGVPNYNKGSKVKFTIGAQGQLTAPGMSLPFKASSAASNSYYISPDASHPQGDSGTVYKNAKYKPLGADLYFVRIKGFTVTQVIYNFELP